MIFRLSKRWKDTLAHLPETGMGSQLVDIILEGGVVLSNIIVFNGEDGESAEVFDPEKIIDVRIRKL